MLGVLGDVVQDVVIWLEEEMRPATDTKSQITMHRGGSAANVAAFAGHRHPTRFIGCVGNDLGGHVVTQELESHGVDVRMQHHDASTGMIVLLIDRKGERMMFPSRGASAMLTPVPACWLDDIDILHVTGYSLEKDPTASSVIEATRHVRAAGGRLSFDVSSTGMIDLYGRDDFSDLIVELSPDFISANRDETHLLGLVDNDTPGPLLQRLGQSVILARAGADDTQIVRGGQMVATVGVQPTDDIRDMTGAGDAFNAGFLSAVVQDSGPQPDLVAACQAGHTLARRVLTHPGASEGAATSPAANSF